MDLGKHSSFVKITVEMNEHDSYTDVYHFQIVHEERWEAGTIWWCKFDTGKYRLEIHSSVQEKNSGDSQFGLNIER